MKVVAQCRLKNGRLEFGKRAEFLTDLARFKDGNYTVTVEKTKKKRSIEQNRYYWGVVVPLVWEGYIHLGWEEMTLTGTHNELLKTFNIIEVVNIHNGEIKRTIGSSTEMSTSQMMDYFAKITRWAATELNVQIPEPGEQLTIQL